MGHDPFSDVEALELYLMAHGRPVAFYSNKYTVFRVSDQGAKSGHGMTQFGRVLQRAERRGPARERLPGQGRVERASRTLQDRLGKDLRLADIPDVVAANAFLPGFTERHNARFAKRPRREGDLPRAPDIEPDRLRDVLSLRDRRYVGARPSPAYEPERILLEETDVTRGLPGKDVDTCAFPDGRLDIRRNGVSLPCSAFDKDRRVTHAAITANRNLSAVPGSVEAEQDKAPPKARSAGKQRTRYMPTGRRNDG